MLTKIGNSKVDSACKDAVKSHLDIPEGSTAEGTLVFTVTYAITRGAGFSKSVPQSACPWTLLALLAQRAGFQRTALTSLASEVMTMDDAQRKTLRDGMSEQVESIMEGIGGMTVKQVAGMQTFKTLEVQVTQVAQGGGMRIL